MSRSLSFSEVSTALTCQARWDYAYGGRLAGSCLRARVTAPNLSRGRAWGCALQAWHSYPRGAGTPTLGEVYAPALARMAGLEAIVDSLSADYDEQFDAGVWINPGVLVDLIEEVSAVFEHYASTAHPLSNLTRIEGEIDLPIPSRRGVRASSRYRFLCKLDGFTETLEGEWIVEFKWRTKKLTPAALIQLSRQIRWEAWARQQETGRPVIGVITEERLAIAPKEARTVQGKRKGTLAPSHAADQLTTPGSYRALCAEYGEEPHPDVIAALEGRDWQKRTPILFEPGELEEAGRELVSAAKLIRDLDSGELYPIRNAQPHICSGCRFKEICPNPDDELYVETLFERIEPKRLRTLETA